MTSTKIIRVNKLLPYTSFRFLSGYYLDIYRIPVKVYTCKLNKAMLCLEFLNGSVIRVSNNLKIEIQDERNIYTRT